MSRALLDRLSQLGSDRQVRIAPGLALLREAAEDAAGAKCAPWQFAVRLNELLAAGLSANDVRWLLTRGLADHALEIADLRATERTFRPTPSLQFCAASAVALRPSAFEDVAAWLPAGAKRAVPLPERAPLAAPRWDPHRREPCAGQALIKRFRVPAPSQELILTAFEEDAWPVRIDDPLPIVSEADPNQRLHDAIRGLNRNQMGRLLKFERDGRGTGVCWSWFA